MFCQCGAFGAKYQQMVDIQIPDGLGNTGGNGIGLGAQPHQTPNHGDLPGAGVTGKLMQSPQGGNQGQFHGREAVYQQMVAADGG